MVYNTYLGQRGYTISKDELTIEEQKQIRNDLMIKPFIMTGDQKIFPAYRESSKNFYVPHYYGIDKFGIPKEYKLSEGHDINVEFVGQLRDYQIPVINKFIQHCITSGFGGGLLELYCAWGKTAGTLKIISELKKKTIVIVHKEFLMNQWIERIQQFLPGARIGKIQGPIIDVEDKDIVLCMLQSLISKDYDVSLFKQFGLTIVDEVHHIASQSFSNSLFKVVTKYMLGLSATMDRKDGSTYVFKMFLGNVIYKSEKKTESMVEVRAITYKVNDDDFNETILDYRGKPQNSSMISKLCEYNRRTEFIIKTLCDFISVPLVENIADSIPNCGLCNKNNNYLIRNTCCNTVQYCMLCMENIELAKGKNERPKCPNCKKVLKYEQNYIENPNVKPLEQTHTIVMAHNLNILHYMYKKFVCKNLASVGYYVGGMSEIELKKTEKKQVILSSYQMCSEGLDIPTLNAAFFITPKTDVIQSVGRVLRAKHAFSHPIIYDMVDSHDVFQRQWLKRKAYYKKQNYKIIGTDSIKYDLQKLDTWKVLNEPKLGCTIVDKSILNDIDESENEYEDEDKDEEEDNNDKDDTSKNLKKDKYPTGTCLLKFKK